MSWKRGLQFLAAAAALVWSAATAADAPFRFAVLGDRTGEARAGVYEQVWEEIAAEHPAFVVTVGDVIEGLHDAALETQWREVERIHRGYRQIPLHLTPGNHDIWSAASERAFREHAGRAPHYSFDYAQAHF